MQINANNAKVIYKLQRWLDNNIFFDGFVKFTMNTSITLDKKKELYSKYAKVTAYIDANNFVIC